MGLIILLSLIFCHKKQKTLQKHLQNNIRCVNIGCKAKMLYKIIMKVEEKNRLIKLFDAYGALLSDGQAEVMAYYINFDFTVSEIAENLGVSRQAVKDSVNKAVKKLYEYEEKLAFVEKTDQLSAQIENLQKQLSKIKEG